MPDRFDVDAILASTDLVELVSRYTPLKKRGNEYVGRCVYHSPDNNPSMCVVPAKKFIHCHSCGEHANAISFLMFMEGVDFIPACKKLLNGTGTLPPAKPIDRPPPQKAPDRITFAPPPEAPPPKMALRNLGEPVQTWTYYTAEGAVLGYAARYIEDGDKTFRCWTWGHRSPDEKPGWACAGFGRPRPIYGLDRLAAKPGAQVVVCEGEKAADAAVALFPQSACISWPQGAKNQRYVDWGVLIGRRVILLPDNDEPGRQAMGEIASILRIGGAQLVKGIKTEYQPDEAHSPEGWDIADAEGWTPEVALGWARKYATEYLIPGEVTQPPEAATATDIKRQAKPALSVVKQVVKPVPKELQAQDSLPPEMSEFGMANYVEAAQVDEWHYTEAWHAWFIWNGKTWVEDKNKRIISLSQDLITANQASHQALTPGQRYRICSKGTVQSVLALTSAKPSIAVDWQLWNSEMWLLGTPEGVIDLRTGQYVEASRDQLINKVTKVVPVPGPHPNWDIVLERACRGDKGMAAYIQKWCGYTLTGSTREERFLFIHGQGRSGKSKFFKPVMEILGDYAKTTPVEAFTARSQSDHPEGIARLAGARLVTASETEEGSRWKEALIKQITGGDQMAARHMRQGTFEYRPTLKLWFIGNHKPALRSVGEEIRGRLDLLEWGGTIPEGERILDLEEKLRGEYPQILAWMIQGCLEWQEQGLGRPEQIAHDTDTYLETQDTLGTWLDTYCEVRNGQMTPAMEAYRSYRSWAEQQGEHVPSSVVFAQKLQARGFTKTRTSQGNVYHGFGVLQGRGSPTSSRYPD